MLTILQAIEDITHDNQFKELHKFQLNERDWKLLQDYQEILEVLIYLLTIDCTDTNLLGSHAFQDLLGAETTPTICYSIPAYSAFINTWENLRYDNWDWRAIIQPGLDKIEEYQARLVDTPAYILAMGETSIFQWIANLILYIAIDPKNKLTFYCKQSQEKYNVAKAMFIEAVSYNDCSLQDDNIIKQLRPYKNTTPLPSRAPAPAKSSH